MARKANKPTYANKAEQLGNPERVMIEVVTPHDGLDKGYQAYKPLELANKMVELGYWKIIEG